LHRLQNGDGQVSFEEFKHIYGEKRASSYVKTLFSLMDTDNSGSIDFKEFLVGVCLNDDSFPDEVRLLVVVVVVGHS
jgi:Ca2+-binding EF-hand superfamily protein